jgi:hypothetical protein
MIKERQLADLDQSRVSSGIKPASMMQLLELFRVIDAGAIPLETLDWAIMKAAKIEQLIQ